MNRRTKFRLAWRETRMIVRGLTSTRHPMLAHIIPMRRCNLACTYCYEFGEDKLADALRKNGDKRRSRMSSETTQQSIDFLFENSTGRDQVNLTFFGGETLLNFDTIRDAVLYVGGSLDRRMGGSLMTVKNRAYVTSTANIDIKVYDTRR